MDKIFIRDIEIYAYHGVNPEENIQGQKFLVSLTLFLDARKAGKSDDLRYSVSYARVCKLAHKLFTDEKYQLLEKTAEVLAEEILTTYPQIQGVIAEVKKPWAPIGRLLDCVSVEISRSWHRAYLGLGANLGDRKENLEKAVSLLESKQTKVQAVSSFYETKPWGYENQPDFLNCALEVRTLLTPRELMEEALGIEQALKRERTIPNGPRTIDIDILLYDDIVSEDPDIILPHPRMEDRLFVLEPLNEIAPWVVHPLLKKRISKLLTEARQ